MDVLINGFREVQDFIAMNRLQIDGFVLRAMIIIVAVVGVRAWLKVSNDFCNAVRLVRELDSENDHLRLLLNENGIYADEPNEDITDFVDKKAIERG